MHRTVTVVLLGCAAALGQAVLGQAVLGQAVDDAGLQSALNVHDICFVDGVKNKTIQSAISGCSLTGAVVVPPAYDGTDSYENPNRIRVLDFRHSEAVKGLTPVTDFGVRNDALTAADGDSQDGSAMFTSASASFVSGRDEGKTIIITGAGTDNASLKTTIRAVNSATRVTLAMAASFTASGLTYWYGTENTSAFQTAYNSGKLLLLPPGKYLLTGTVKGSTPLFLSGSGVQSVIVDDGAVFDLRGTEGHFLDHFRMLAATKLTSLPPSSFPTAHAGTPVAVDRIGAGIGYQPELQDGDIWAKVSQQQRAQQIGPTIVSASDRTYIYRITGELVSLLLYDVQFSEVAMCDFRAGKNFAGGIVLWHTPNDGKMNKNDKIHDNHVRYASYSGIVWAAAEGVSIRHNRSEFNGESGLKNYATQGDGTYDTHVEVVGNFTQHNHFDGLDLSENYPHTNAPSGHRRLRRETPVHSMTEPEPMPTAWDGRWFIMCSRGTGFLACRSMCPTASSPGIC